MISVFFLTALQTTMPATIPTTSSMTASKNTATLTITHRWLEFVGSFVLTKVVMTVGDNVVIAEDEEEQQDCTEDGDWRGWLEVGRDCLCTVRKAVGSWYVVEGVTAVALVPLCVCSQVVGSWCVVEGVTAVALVPLCVCSHLILLWLAWKMRHPKSWVLKQKSSSENKGKGLYTASSMLNLRVVLTISGLQNVNTVGLGPGAKNL